MGLRGYLLQRIGYLIVLIFFVITLNFFIFMLMPGDPIYLMVNPQKYRPEEYTRLLDVWGFNDPIYVRYFKYVVNMVTWNFGKSMSSGVQISTEMASRLPYTIFLLGGSTVLALIIGVLLGVVAAYKRGSRLDDVNVVFGLTFYSLPVFWMGMVFLMIFSKDLGWFPLAHAYPSEWLSKWPAPAFSTNILGLAISIPTVSEIAERVRYTFLPMATLTLFQYGGWLLLTRATMLETLTEDYVLTAKAKGVKTRTILLKHALKNASLPLITNAALSLGFMFSGAIITETVYTWPGMGRWIYEAINNTNYPVLQAVFFVIALCVVFANFIADLIYGFVDPRIKYD
jgi:peptide/nickel transport system permease protein